MGKLFGGHGGTFGKSEGYVVTPPRGDKPQNLKSEMRAVKAVREAYAFTASISLSGPRRSMTDAWSFSEKAKQPWLRPIAPERAI
jgi:hypothetical protein